MCARPALICQGVALIWGKILFKLFSSYKCDQILLNLICQTLQPGQSGYEEEAVEDVVANAVQSSLDRKRKLKRSSLKSFRPFSVLHPRDAPSGTLMMIIRRTGLLTRMRHRDFLMPRQYEAFSNLSLESQRCFNEEEIPAWIGGKGRKRGMRRRSSQSRGFRRVAYSAGGGLLLRHFYGRIAPHSWRARRVDRDDDRQS